MTVSWPSQDDLLKWLSSDLSNWGRWGSDDQKGTLNHLSPEKTLQAVSLVSEGVIVSCARPVDFKASVDVPRPPQHFMVSAGDTYRKGESAVRGDRQVAIDYFGLIFHGHTVTHIDSLAHFFWDGQTYNGRPSSVVSTAEGATEFDVMAAAGGIVTKGVLVDAPLLRGVDFIERGDGVGVADIEAAEREHGVRVEKGDVLLLRTGQLGRREVTGPVDVRVDGSSGPSPEILPLLYERDVAVMGSDTGNDIGPNPYDRFTNPVHQVGIVGLGLWILDNAWLDDLAEACVRRGKWEFMFSVLPLKLPAVTGSPVNPVAIF
ncbi:MAG: cyclase family protein [Chloroflexi bacterium]|nr:cyclase family protein [Chloroflexota bacterium]